MLTQLRLKNWRSIKKATIDFTPITVLIGANSSGKTNIIDALYFLRESCEEGVLQAVQNRQGNEKIHFLDTPPTEAIEIEFSFQSQSSGILTYTLAVQFDPAQPDFPYPTVTELLKDDSDIVWLQVDARGVTIRSKHNEPLISIAEPPFGWEQTILASFGNVPIYPQIYETYQYITQRWQMLDENFMPPLSAPMSETGDIYVIDRCADNLPFMLDFMFKVNGDLHQRMQDDLGWMLGHIDTIETIANEREIRIALREKSHPDREAPTVSAGSTRVLAVLGAYYALELKKRAEAPALLVIEEPDTALNPGLLRKFVEQIRNYVEGEHPRQFIFTTHNPSFLNYFEPEEVRVVGRDEQGFTTVTGIPDHIREIWLDEYGLGEVWFTNSFGGLPE